MTKDNHGDHGFFAEENRPTYTYKFPSREPKKDYSEEDVIKKIREKVNQQRASVNQMSLFDKPVGVSVWEGLPSDWNPIDALDRAEVVLSHWDSKASSSTKDYIVIYCLMLMDLLLKKNERYGNSATEPISVFAKDISAKDRINVRIDDKISRILRGGSFGDKEDPRVDLAGYLILAFVLDALGD